MWPLALGAVDAETKGMSGLLLCAVPLPMLLLPLIILPPGLVVAMWLERPLGALIGPRAIRVVVASSASVLYDICDNIRYDEIPHTHFGCLYTRA